MDEGGHLSAICHDNRYGAARFQTVRERARDGCRICAIWRDGILAKVDHDGFRLDDTTTVTLTPSWAMLIYEISDGRAIDNHEDYGLELFKTSASPIPWLPRIPSAKILPGDTGCEASFASLTKWLSNCASQHSLCGADGQAGRSNVGSIPDLPTRFLDVTSHNGALGVRLSTRHCAPAGHYIALSHCWGNVRASSLTTKITLSQNLRHIE